MFARKALNRNVIGSYRDFVTLQFHQYDGEVQTGNIVAKQIGPNDVITFPHDIPKPLHGIIEFIRLSEVNVLVAELVVIPQEMLRAAKSIKLCGHGGLSSDYDRDGPGQ